MVPYLHPNTHCSRSVTENYKTESKLESFIRKIVKEERKRMNEKEVSARQQAGLGQERYYIGYYETNGGHGESGTFSTFDSAFNTAKRQIKDTDFMDGLEYVGVEGAYNAEQFAILLITESYLNRLTSNMFSSPEDFKIFKVAAIKYLKTKKIQIGKFDG